MNQRNKRNSYSVRIKHRKKEKNIDCLLWCSCSQQTSGVARGLDYRRYLAERDPLASVRDLLVITQKKAENWWWIGVWMAILKPQNNGKYSAKRKKATQY